MVSTSGWIVKPTLISANDVASITGISWNETGSDVSFEIGNTYWWLYDRTYNCTSNGCQTEDNSTFGYWTSTNKNTTSSNVWYVRWDAYLIANIQSNSSNEVRGVRPVITISKSIL